MNYTLTLYLRTNKRAKINIPLKTLLSLLQQQALCASTHRRILSFTIVATVQNYNNNHNIIFSLLSTVCYTASLFFFLLHIFHQLHQLRNYHPPCTYSALTTLFPALELHPQLAINFLYNQYITNPSKIHPNTLLPLPCCNCGSSSGSPSHLALPCFGGNPPSNGATPSAGSHLHHSSFGYWFIAAGMC